MPRAAKVDEGRLLSEAIVLKFCLGVQVGTWLRRYCHMYQQCHISAIQTVGPRGVLPQRNVPFLHQEMTGAQDGDCKPDARSEPRSW